MSKLLSISWSILLCCHLVSCGNNNSPNPDPNPNPAPDANTSNEAATTSTFMNLNGVQMSASQLKDAEALHAWWQKELQINRQAEEFKVTCDDGKACVVSYYYGEGDKVHSIQIDCKSAGSLDQEDREIRYYYFKDGKLAIYTVTRLSWIVRKGSDGTPEPSLYNMSYYYLGSVDVAIGGSRYMEVIADAVTEADIAKILSEKLNVFEAMDMEEAQSLYDEGNNMGVMLPQMTSPVACGVIAED